VRIITGKAKGIRLKTLEGDNTRPTSERVKEAVFSMLQFDIEGRSILDLYSGSGQMALEALSRGATSAVLVDKAKDAVAIIKDNVKKTGFEADCIVYQSDCTEAIKRLSGKCFDIVFIDPPYAAKLYRSTLIALIEYKLLKPTTLIVCESGESGIFDGDTELEAKFAVIKKSKYSKTDITIFKLNTEEDRDCE